MWAQKHILLFRWRSYISKQQGKTMKFSEIRPVPSASPSASSTTSASDEGRHDLWRCLDAHDDIPVCSATLQAYLLEYPDAIDENERTPACRVAFQSKKLLARTICQLLPESGKPDRFGLNVFDYLSMIYPIKELEARQRASHELGLKIQGKAGIEGARKSQAAHHGIKREDPP